jgi:hypothetical protein
MMGVVAGTSSYGTLAEATTYFEDSVLFSVWSGLPEVKRSQGLTTATRQLEMQAWDGQKEVSTQILDFPRTGLTDCEGNPITPEESLVFAKNASFEYALAILTNPSILNKSDVTGTNIKKIEAGSAKVTYFSPVKGTKYPTQVLSLVKCFFAGSSGGLVSMGVSGNGDTSSFSSGAYDLSRGFK